MDEVKLTESLEPEILSLGELSPSILTESDIMNGLFEIFTSTRAVCTDFPIFEQGLLSEKARLEGLKPQTFDADSIEVIVK